MLVFAKKIVFGLSLLLLGAAVQASEVRVQSRGEGWTLLRDGQPFQIHGAAAFTRFDLFQQIGGNTLRVFGPEHDFVLPEARKRGLAVIYGFDLGHPERGFDYNNPQAVAAQQQAALARAASLQHQPEILMWALGNELELKLQDPAPAFRAVNALARALKQQDPTHPTMIVVAETWPEKVAALLANCPDVDILGINSYGGALDAAARARQAGWRKPIVITEFGSPGHWEMPATAWGAAIEPTSTAKSAVYARAWEEGVARPPFVLGGVAFLWGSKQEVTPTWYGMLLEDGARLAAVDAMAQAWRGTLPFAAAPRLDGLQVIDHPPHMRPGETVTIEAQGTPLAASAYHWALRGEAPASQDNREGHTAPALIAGRIDGQGARIRLRAPEQAGNYRLYLRVDGTDHSAATANLPLHVE